VIKKYVGLFAAFFKASLTADLEFRANIVIRILTDFMWYIAQLSTFEVLYRQTDRIGTWTRGEVRVFLGVLFLVDATYMILFHDNMDKLSEKVRKGELDLLLAKPVNSQFIMSIQRMAPAYIANCGLCIAYLLWSFANLEVERTWFNFAWLMLLVPCGVMILYCGRFFFSAVALIYTGTENVNYLWYQLYRLGMRPDVIYFPWLKYILLSLFPVGMIASVPARALLYPDNPLLFLWTVLVTALFIFLTTKFWRIALRNYSSASS
jgi:ABC-2 type transport system permease protein